MERLLQLSSFVDDRNFVALITLSSIALYPPPVFKEQLLLTTRRIGFVKCLEATDNNTGVASSRFRRCHMYSSYQCSQ